MKHPLDLVRETADALRRIADSLKYSCPAVGRVPEVPDSIESAHAKENRRAV